VAGMRLQALVLGKGWDPVRVYKDGKYQVLADGGCLGGDAGGVYKADARAFAVALVKPPLPGVPPGAFAALTPDHEPLNVATNTRWALLGEGREVWQLSTVRGGVCARARSRVRGGDLPDRPARAAHRHYGGCRQGGGGERYPTMHRARQEPTRAAALLPPACLLACQPPRAPGLILTLKPPSPGRCAVRRATSARWRWGTGMLRSAASHSATSRCGTAGSSSSGAGAEAPRARWQ
jgi:hypothetical protein